MIQSVVRDSIIGVLGLETDFQIDPLQGFTDLGFDSLTSLELRNRLQAQMGRPLPATLAFDFPTMAALVNYFCKESMEAPEAERELEDFELAQLSAEETEQLLAEELAKTRGMP
jgi:acyl carrier protein